MIGIDIARQALRQAREHHVDWDVDGVSASLKWDDEVGFIATLGTLIQPVTEKQALSLLVKYHVGPELGHEDAWLERRF